MIEFKDLIVGHYYGGQSPKGNVAQWDGEDFAIYVEHWDGDWGHVFLAHPQQTGEDVQYGIVETFTPYVDLTLKEFVDGES